MFYGSNFSEGFLEEIDKILCIQKKKKWVLSTMIRYPRSPYEIKETNYMYILL